MTHCQAEFHPDCTGIAVHRHHLKLRRHGDDTTIGVCVFCHDLIHREPSRARESGLLYRSYETIPAGLCASNQRYRRTA